MSYLLCRPMAPLEAVVRHAILRRHRDQSPCHSSLSFGYAVAVEMDRVHVAGRDLRAGSERAAAAKLEVGDSGEEVVATRRDWDSG